MAGIATFGENPALQTMSETVRFFAFTRTELVPAGRVCGRWPESFQFPLPSEVPLSSVVRTTPFASTTWSLIERFGSQALALIPVIRGFSDPSDFHLAALVHGRTPGVEDNRRLLLDDGQRHHTEGAERSPATASVAPAMRILRFMSSFSLRSPLDESASLHRDW